jgi:NAD(P)-dependent dehydrogenase (short-subunit alcohol dehydrogenase family)
MQPTTGRRIRVDFVSKPVAMVVGAGPGVSGSVARRFGAEGYDVALVGRNEAVLTELSRSLHEEGVDARWKAADLTDGQAFRAAVHSLGEEAGHIDVLHFNPSAFRQKSPMELAPEELAADMALGVGALLTAVQAARPFMSAGGRVTATGSMAADEPWHEAASLGVQKAGLRNLVRSIDATLQPDGIRAVSVTVRGTLGHEGAFTPDRVAAAIFAAATQDEGEWSAEVPYSG